VGTDLRAEEVERERKLVRSVRVARDMVVVVVVGGRKALDFRSEVTSKSSKTDPLSSWDQREGEVQGLEESLKDCTVLLCYVKRRGRMNRMNRGRIGFRVV
jgi:hypothetical protein